MVSVSLSLFFSGGGKGSFNLTIGGFGMYFAGLRGS